MSNIIPKKPKLKNRKTGKQDAELAALLEIEQLPTSIAQQPRALTPAEFKRVNWKDCDELERRFVEEFTKDWNGTRACQRAGYQNKTYGAFAVRASQLLRRDNVRAAVAQCQEFLGRKTLVTKERIIREYARIGFSDIRDYSKEDGTVRDAHDLDDDTAAAVKKIEQVDYYEGYGEDRVKLGVAKKIELHEKKAALDSLCRIMGYNPSEHLDVSGSIQHDHRHLHVGLNWDDMPLELLKKIKGEVDARRSLLTDESQPK